MKQPTFCIPADVPQHATYRFKENYCALTQNTGNLFLFSCDQKIEHLHDDFYGPSIPAQVGSPDYFFSIAAHGAPGALATHVGLLARYAAQTPINYVAKLNGKTNAYHTKDPYSALLWDVKKAQELQKNGIAIRGIGITIYVGSSYEPHMLEQAAHAIYHAHQHGLVAIVWAYARGQHIQNEHDPLLIAGLAGLCASLGADFAKIKPPHANNTISATQALRMAAHAAGNTKLVCSGGPLIDIKELLTTIHTQLQAGSAGVAMGRNIFQRPFAQACALSKAIHALVYHAATAEKALAIYQEESTKKFGK